MTVTVCDIAAEHLSQLAQLYQELQPNEPSPQNMEAAFLATVQDPDHILLGAEMDSQLVATVLGVACQMLFGSCKRFMVVEDVVVSHRYRRLGVGSLLMREIENRARARNCSYIMLITDQDRPQAHRFYRSLDYECDSYVAFKKKL